MTFVLHSRYTQEPIKVTWYRLTTDDIANAGSLENTQRPVSADNARDSDPSVVSGESTGTCTITMRRQPAKIQVLETQRSVVHTSYDCPPGRLPSTTGLRVVVDT